MNKAKLEQFEALEIEKKHQIHLKGGTDDKKKKAESEPAVEEIEIAYESFTVEWV